MAVKAAVVTGTITGSGSTDFTSSSFGTPDAAIVFMSLANTAANPNASARLSIGFWDGTAQYSVATYAGDSITSSDTYGLAAAYAAQMYPDRLWSISNITDGVRLSWVSGSAVSSNLYTTVVLLGGLTNKKVGVQDLGTGTSAINVTAPNFRADLVFLATVAKDGTGTRDGLRLSFGAAHLNSSDVASQGSVGLYSEDAVSTMKTGCLARDDKALAIASGVADSEVWNVAVGAYSTGFSLTPSASTGNSDAYYLAIELPDPDDAHVVVDVAATSTGDDAYTGAGFEPVALILAGALATNANTVTQEGAVWFGAGTESAQRSIAICDEDAQADADTESYCATDKILHIRRHGGTADAEATLGSFDADGWTLNYSDAASSAWKYLAIAIGASTGGTTITGTGALASQSASIAGSGTAYTTITGTGALASQAAAVSGAGTVGAVVTGTGALAAGSASVAGTGKRVVTGFAELLAGSASISAAGLRTIVATGALAAQAATINGTGLRTVVGTGALAAQASDITGTGQLEGVVSGSGQLAAGSASISGAGEVTGAKTGTGALAAGSAAIAGTGAVVSLITGTGALAAGSASVVGTGAVVAPTVITGTGAIQAGQATINGVGIREVTGMGSLIAGNATINGYQIVVAGWLCATPSVYPALRATPSAAAGLTATVTTYPEGCG